MSRRIIGREATDQLKAILYQGIPLTIGDAQHMLAVRGVPGRYLGKHAVGGWLREARYELAEENLSVTNPIRKFAFTSNPSASANERIDARKRLISEIRTRARHLRQYLESDARQVDADPEEIRNGSLAEVLVDVAEKIAV